MSMSLASFGEAFRGTLDSGVELFVWPTKSFKSEIVRLTQSSLLDDRCGWRALYSAVLRRGTEKYPTTLAFSRALEEFYGTSLSYDVSRRGQEQLLSWSTDTADQRFLSPSTDDVSLRDTSWRMLKEVLETPAKEGGLLKKEFVERESENLVRYLESLINDKMAFAHMRLFELMYPQDPYGLNEWGTVQSMNDITSMSLTPFGESFVNTAPSEVYVSGSLDVEEAIERVRKLTEGLSPGTPITPQVPTCESLSDWREVIEEQDVNQAKMILGCRVDVQDMSDRVFTAMALMNMALGDGMHSKLFKVVRERESLAYSISSSLDRLAGHLSISSGIDSQNYEKARDLSFEQIRKIAAGEISSDEMDAIKAAFNHRMRGVADHPAAMVGFLAFSRSTKRFLTPEEWIILSDGIEVSDIASCAEQVTRHTAYLLREPR